MWRSATERSTVWFEAATEKARSQWLKDGCVLPNAVMQNRAKTTKCITWRCCNRNEPYDKPALLVFFMDNDQWLLNQFESDGGTCRARNARENFLCRAPPLFWLSKYNSRFGERFRDGQYSLVSLLRAVLLLMATPCQAIKSGGGGHVPYGVGTTDKNHL